jgi:anti-sigma factor RsiW
VNCEHLRPDLGAYVLGGLDPDEAAAVKRHLESCPECAAEYEALAQLPDLLSLAGGAEEATAEPLSPAFEERLLDAFARDRSVSPRRRRRRLAWRPLRPRWLAIGAAALVTAAAAAAGIAVLDEDEQPARRYQLTFQNVSAPPSASAQANLESGPEGTTVHLLVRGLPAEDAVYEVLCDAEEWTASAGTFRTDAEGHAYVILTTALRKDEYNAIRIVRRGHRADGTLYKRNVLTARLS